MLKIFKWAGKDWGKWEIIFFITFVIVAWICVQTGGQYDFIEHRGDKNAHQSRITRLENHLLILKRENAELKYKQEILKSMLAAVPEIIKGEKVEIH